MEVAKERNGQSAMQENLSQFSYEYYRHMLSAAQANGYRLSSFAGYEEGYAKTVIIRHDVDYTMDGLLKAASIEYELGVSATYLFRIHADQYNLFTPYNWNIVQTLADMGHEIGLHFEGMNVGRALGIDPVELINKERRILEAMLGFEVLTASEHRELSGAIHGTDTFHNVYDFETLGFKYFAMDPKYCREMKYLSDSNANWREGDLLENLNKHARFQILTHLDWWFEKDLLLKGPYYHPS